MEQDLKMWMKAIGVFPYHCHFQAGGISRGSDLQGLDDARLLSIGVKDELHRQVILECLEELVKGNSSLVSDGKAPWWVIPPSLPPDIN